MRVGQGICTHLESQRSHRRFGVGDSLEAVVSSAWLSGGLPASESPLREAHTHNLRHVLESPLAWCAVTRSLSLRNLPRNANSGKQCLLSPRGGICFLSRHATSPSLPDESQSRVVGAAPLLLAHVYVWYVLITRSLIPFPQVVGSFRYNMLFPPSLFCAVVFHLSFHCAKHDIVFQQKLFGTMCTILHYNILFITFTLKKIQLLRSSQRKLYSRMCNMLH